MNKVIIVLLSILTVFFLTAQTCSYGGVSTGLAADCVGEEDIVCDEDKAYQCQLASYGVGYYVTRATAFDSSECNAEQICASQDDCSEGYCIAGTCVEEITVTTCSSNAECAEDEVCLPEYNICYTEPTASCADTDVSNDPTVLGKIYGLSFADGEEAEGEEDICADDGTGSWEFYCDEESDYITAEFVACDDGMICSEGICQETEGTRCMSADDCTDDEVCAPYTDTCQEAPATGCVDTDEANDPYTAGTISGASDYDFTDITDWPDRCAPDRESVIEYYCHESGYVAAERIACDTDEFCNPSLGVCETAIISGVELGAHTMVELESREALVASADLAKSGRAVLEVVDASSGARTMSALGITAQSMMTSALASSLGGSTSYKKSPSIFISGITAVTPGAFFTYVYADCGATVYGGVVGEEIIFDGSASTGDITLYTWSFGDGTEEYGASSVNTHSFTSASTYKMQLSVESDSDSDMCEADVIITS
ncbi:PKD domain-containing protein [Candidatus Woesearchaeota archaeon]|nr:PKD domain-containing protein [Candidatus Woesearchaeota archaeon]